MSDTQAQQIGAQFDGVAGQVTALFNAIQSQSVITEADLTAALAAYQQLAGIAQQFSSIPYVAQQWNSEDYKPAYEERLRQIAAAVVPVGNQQSTPTIINQPAAVSVGSIFSNPLTLVVAGLLAWAVLKR